MRVAQIGERREQLIRSRARALAHKYLTLPGRTLPVDPRDIATELLGLGFEEPEEIGTVLGGNSMRVEVVGAFDRTQRKIIVARRGCNATTRRFTAAHEIGHYEIHPGLSLLRESPRTEPEIRTALRTPREREEDIFVSEFLIPSDHLADLFGRMFGTAIDGSQLTDDDAYLLSEGNLRASQMMQMEPLELAKLVAKGSSFVRSDSRSLVEIFDVSTTAMAIQLLDSRLVSKSSSKGQVR